MELVTQILNNVPVETVITALGAAGVLSIVLQKFKKWFELQSNSVVNWLNAIISFVAVAIQGLMSATAANPTLLPGKALGLMGLTILVYNTPYIGVKALSQLIADVKETRERKARTAEKNAAEEVPVVPIESVVPQVEPLPAVAVDAPVALTPVTPEAFTPQEFAA